MSKVNWVRDEDLPKGNAHKVGNDGWEHWVVECNGRERWLSVNMDGLESALAGFVARVLSIAYPATDAAVGGEAQFGGWWGSFKTSIATVAKLAIENRDKIAKLTPGGIEAAERLIASYRGGDSEAARQIAKIADEAKKGNKQSAALLDALRAEEMQQDTAAIPMIRGAAKVTADTAAMIGAEPGETRHLVESVTTGTQAWMTDAEFGKAVAKRRPKSSSTATAAQKAAQAKARAKATAAQRLRARPGTLSTSVLSQHPGLQRPMTNYSQPSVGYPQQPAWQSPYQPYGQPGAPMGYPTDPRSYADKAPGGGDDDVTEEDMAAVWGPDGNLPTDDADDEGDGNYGAEIEPDDQEPDEGLQPDEDLANTALPEVDSLDNQGSADVAGELSVDPLDNVPAEADDPLNTSLDNQGDPEMGGAYKSTLDEAKVVAKLSAGDRAQLKALKKTNEIKIFLAQKASEQQARRAAEVKGAIANIIKNTQRQIQQVKAQSGKAIEQRSAAERRLNVRRAEQAKYEDKIARLDDELRNRDVSDDKRVALETQRAAYEQQITSLNLDEKERAFELESRKLAMEEDRNEAAILAQHPELAAPAPEDDDDASVDGDAELQSGL